MSIMVSGPYTTGAASRADRERNLADLNRVAVLFQKGHVPVVGVNLAMPICDTAGREQYDGLALAERCDAVLRLDGESSGADREVERIRAHGGTVYRSLDDVPDAGSA